MSGLASDPGALASRRPEVPSARLPLLVFGVLAAGIVAAGAIHHRNHGSTARREVERQLDAVAALKVGQISAWRIERLADVAIAAANPLLSLAPESGEDAARSVHLRFAYWFRAFGIGHGYRAAAILDESGRTVASWGLPTQDIQASPADVAEARARGGPVLSDLRRGPDGRAYLDGIAPLAAGRGLVVLRIDPAEDLFPLVQTWPVPSPTAETLLVRREGDEVLFLNELRHRSGAALALRLPLARTDLPAVRAALGQDGLIEARDYRGEPVLAATWRIPASPWALVAKVDRSEVSSRAAGDTAWTAALVASLLIACAAGAGLWWHQQGAAFYRRQYRLEAERAALLGRIEMVTQQANDIIFLAGEDLRLLEVNDRAVALLGYGRDELLRMRLTDIQDAAAPGDLGGAWSREAGLVFQTRYRRKDGTTFPVEVSSRALEVDGRACTQGIARDITERLAAEEALRASEAKFRAAFEEASIGILITGADGRIVEFNRALQEMLGYPPEALRGASIGEIAHPDDAARAVAGLREMVGGERNQYSSEKRYRRRDGRAVLAVVHGAAVRDGQGRFRFAVSTVEDVTERRAIEARLVLADRLTSLGTLAAGMAHEINNPLSCVLGNVGFALAELGQAPGLAPEVVEALRDADEGAVRVRDIVRDLKVFARENEEDRGPSDLRKVLGVSVALAQHEIRRRARLSLALDDLPLVPESEHRLGQVFLNLLVNAAQAIPEGRVAENEIRVTARLDDSGRVRVEVADTGAGIPPEVVGRIFDPFFTTKPVGVGTGLGLFVCHGIVSHMGGEIQVESQPGRGTVFRVFLPPVRAGPAPQPAPGPPAAAPERSRLLVVDDEPGVRRTLSRILSPLHEVVAVASARDALAAVASGQRFDLVMCDLMMPELTGMDLHASLAGSHPGLAGTMVFITGGAVTPAAQEFLERVPNARVEKPFDPEELRGTVADLLRRGGQA